MKSKVQWKSLSDKSTSSFCPIQQFLSNIVVISGWGWLDICFLWNSLISPNHWIAHSRPVIVGRMLIFSKVYYRENFQSIYFRQSLNPPQVRDYEVLSDFKKNGFYYCYCIGSPILVRTLTGGTSIPYLLLLLVFSQIFHH